MKHKPKVWVPVIGPSTTAMLDMDAALSCALIAWLLAKLQKSNQFRE